MQVSRGYLELDLDVEDSAVTIGNFDGVHLGHQRVMQSAIDAARARDAESVVCTFDPHTLHVVKPDAAPALLQTLEQRLTAMEELGLDRAIVIPFDERIARTSPEEFVDEFLVGVLEVGSLHVSKGFSFGKDRAGNRAYLERRAGEFGFRVLRVPAVLVDGDPVSSSRIRQLVGEGRVEEVVPLLGRHYAVDGIVKQGAGRGRDLGTPTANLDVANGCLPGKGVYAAHARAGGREWEAVTNVGTRPTFDDDPALTVEAHLLNYDGGDLYGQRLELALVARLRDEFRFESESTLREQIDRDIEDALEVLEPESLG